jgi:HAD superfamily hydrolase (TIGR01509 family)
MSDVQLVVFDLGGVLVRIVRSWEEAHEAAGLGAKLVPDSERFRRERVRLAHAHQTGAIESGAYFEEMAAASEGAYTAEEIERVIAAWQYAEYEGVGGVVDALEAVGVETAALSNTNAFHWAELRLDGGATRFPTVRRLRHAFASHLVRAAKPEQAIYETVERETGVASERVLFFDDVEAYVVGARDAGWRAERIDPMGDTAAQLMGHLGRYGVLGR